MGLSRNKIKYIQSLKDKKFRNEYRVFVAEGDKLARDLMETGTCQLIAALPEWIMAHPGIKAEEVITATPLELSKATFLKTPPPVIAVFHRPEYNISEFDAIDRLMLVLDGIQDPGNVGTIVRVADWFGIEHIICSPDTADIYSPKTVQATMGAVARVKTIYTDIVEFLQQKAHLPIYGTFLDGNNIYAEELSDTGIIVMGSEGKGIGFETEKAINKRLFIPSFPAGKATSESLNVAAAAAIVCSEFRRRQGQRIEKST